MEASINQFSWYLYREMAKEVTAADNVLFSPLSVYFALSIVFAGSRGKTADQIKSVLKILSDPESQDHNIRLKKIIDRFENASDKDVIFGNSVWVENSSPIRSEFKKLLHMFYDAEIRNVNFLNNPLYAVFMMNQWIDVKTRGKIKNIIKSHLFSADTQMVLTNFIYFKLSWKYSFKKENTKLRSFHVSKNSVIEVPLMHQQNKFKFLKDHELDSKFLLMPYKGGEIVMMFILPNAKDGLDTLESKLKPELVIKKYEALTKSREEKVDIFIPKFKFSVTSNLKTSLMHLGIVDLFLPSSDLSGMSSANSLFVSDVLHKAYVEVDEEGTEASAVTIINIALRSRQMIRAFKADHPFLFLIVDNTSRLVLFSGRVCSPIM